MYQVKNLTSRVVVLSDLRAEIGSHKELDLEKICHYADIDRSMRSGNLRRAIDNGTLVVVKETNIQPKAEVRVVEKVVERNIDTNQLKKAIREVISEQKSTNSEDAIIKAVIQGLGPYLESLQAGAGIVKEEKVIKPLMDDEKFAEFQMKAVDKMTESIETAPTKQVKKFTLETKKKLNDLLEDM